MSNILTPINSCDSESTHQIVSNNIYNYEIAVDSEFTNQLLKSKKLETNYDNMKKSQIKELKTPPNLNVINKITNPPKLTPIKFSTCKSASFHESIKNNDQFNSKLNIQKSLSVETTSIFPNFNLNSNFDIYNNDSSSRIYSYKSESILNRSLGISSQFIKNGNSDESDNSYNTNIIQQSTDVDINQCKIDQSQNDFNFILYDNKIITTKTPQYIDFKTNQDDNKEENIYQIEMLGNNKKNLEQLINSCDLDNFSIDGVVHSNFSFDNQYIVKNILGLNNNGNTNGTIKNNNFENVNLPLFQNSCAFGDESSIPLGTAAAELLFPQNQSSISYISALKDYDEVALFGNGAAIQRHFYESNNNDLSSQYVIARPPGTGSYNNTSYYNLNNQSLYNPETMVEIAQNGIDTSNTLYDQSKNSYLNYNQDTNNSYINQTNKRSQNQLYRNINDSPRRRNVSNRKRRDSQDPQAAVKRENHNMLERKRRSELRDSFGLLVELLPELRGVSLNRLSKVKILIAATNYIKCFQSSKNLRERLVKERRRLLVNISKKLEECSRKFNTSYTIGSQELNN